jgi:serine/threonine-protein kinase RsbW
MGSAGPEFVQLTTVGDGRARQELLERIGSKLAKLGWASSDIFGLQMAIEESVSNAYRHGNLNGHRGNVEINWQISESEFMMEVHDHGNGFDESTVPDPTELNNLESLTGRGLLLMRNYMSDIDFRDAGRTVVMRKTKSEEG